MSHYSYGIVFLVLGSLFLVLNSYLLFSDIGWKIKQGTPISKRFYLMNGFMLAMALLIIMGGAYYLFTVYSQLRLG